MDDDHKYPIPAAGIGNTDLEAVARTNPAAAQEIARLRDLMNLGEDTNDEFFRLCQLLFDVGSVAAAEILLRRNLDDDEGEALYIRLFGTTKQDEFDVAIEAFQSQFEVHLSSKEERGFLVSVFHSHGGPPRWDEFALLSQRCEVEIGYIEEDNVEANVVLFDPGRAVFGRDECLFMYFVNGVWELADPMDA